jgi:hypothetical protein
MLPIKNDDNKYKGGKWNVFILQSLHSASFRMVYYAKFRIPFTIELRGQT